jgi:hypothetical protein
MRKLGRASMIPSSPPRAVFPIERVLAQPVYNRARYPNLMSDRKYRQRGYQDDGRDRPATPKPQRPAPEPGAPAGARRISQDGPAPSSRARLDSTAVASDAAPTCTPARSARRSIPAADSNACNRYRHESRPRTRRIPARCTRPGPRSSGKPRRHDPTTRGRRLTTCSSRTQ